MTRSTMATWLPLLALALVLAVTAGVLWAQPGQGGPGGPGGRGRGMQATMYLDRAWTAVSFGLDATPDQITALQPTFKAAYDTRTEAMTKAMGAQDRQAAMQELQTVMDQIKQDLDNKMREVLNADQMTKLQQLTQPQGRPPQPPPPPQG